MRLRSYLTVLTLATLVPVAIFAAIVGANLLDLQRQTFRLGAHDRVLAISTAIDVELSRSVDTLRALALSPSLAQGDLRYFRLAASTLLASQPDWININLALPDGQHLRRRARRQARLPGGGEADWRRRDAAQAGRAASPHRRGALALATRSVSRPALFAS